LYIHEGNRHHRFEIRCTGGSGVIWKFEGQDLSVGNSCQNSRTRKVCGNKLFITKPLQSYAGKYTCKDPTTGSVATATVQVQPEFAKPKKTDYSAAVNDTVAMSCSLRPPTSGMDVWWFKEGKVVGIEEKHTIVRASLHDSGTYTCEVRNHPTSYVSKTINLYVYGKSDQLH
jgi:hypothetical protein